MRNRRGFDQDFKEREQSRRFQLARRHLEVKRCLEFPFKSAHVYYSNCLMTEACLTSPTLVDSENFLMMLMPEGERVILVSLLQKTLVYSYSGFYLGVAAVSLPANDLAEEYCMVDCVMLNDAFYVRDVILWEGTSLVNVPATQRLQFLQESIVVPGLTVLPVLDCNAHEFSKVAAAEPLSHQQGLLFFHKNSRYTHSLNPDVLLWRRPQTDSAVLLKCTNNGELLTLEDIVVHTVPKSVLYKKDLVAQDIVKCLATGISNDLAISQLELLEESREVRPYSLSRILFDIGGFQADASGIQEVLSSSREAETYQNLTYDYITESVSPTYTDETVHFLSN